MTIRALAIAALLCAGCAKPPPPAPPPEPESPQPPPPPVIPMLGWIPPLVSGGLPTLTPEMLKRLREPRPPPPPPAPDPPPLLLIDIEQVSAALYESLHQANDFAEDALAAGVSPHWLREERKRMATTIEEILESLRESQEEALRARRTLRP